MNDFYIKCAVLGMVCGYALKFMSDASDFHAVEIAVVTLIAFVWVFNDAK